MIDCLQCYTTCFTDGIADTGDARLVYADQGTHRSTLLHRGTHRSRRRCALSNAGWSHDAIFFSGCFIYWTMTTLWGRSSLVLATRPYVPQGTWLLYADALFMEYLRYLDLPGGRRWSQGPSIHIHTSEGAVAAVLGNGVGLTWSFSVAGGDSSNVQGQRRDVKRIRECIGECNYSTAWR